MSNKNEVFEYLIDQLRQQVNNNQCEDLAHEVQSLKNQLRDASAQIKELHLALVRATGDAEAYKLIRKGEHGPEQSGCRKEDAQECEHSWIIMPGLFLSEGNPDNVPGSELCSKCGKREWDDAEYKPKNDTQECEHDCRKEDVRLPVCQCVPAHCGTYHGNTIVCDNCGGVIPE